jgi:hypothetical protein
MGALSWIMGVGVPTLAGAGLLVGAAFAWFRLPDIGHYLGLALACVGVAMLANARGFSDARALCNDAALRAEIASLRRDIDTAHEAQAFAVSQSRNLAAAEQSNRELADEIAAMPDDCLADADHVRRLLRVK